MTTLPARIHVLLAREAPLGLVIRRGPSKHVATLLWDREHDTFQLGQWLKGRIYERRCDLSPDGNYLIYFAMNGKWDAESKGSWSAISRAPYLKALAMFPKGDCWYGGGLWTSNRSYWLNDGYEHQVLHDTDEVRRDTDFDPSERFGPECTGVYYPRLLRDGWRLVAAGDDSEENSLDTFEKPLWHGWTLRKFAHAEVNHPVGKGCYWDEHELVHAASGTLFRFPDWEWADWDFRRLLWASGGKLFAGTVSAEGLADESELMDFNPMTSERIKAPY